MSGNRPEPVDHPALAKYPDSPTVLYTADGVTWRVPMHRDRDEAVPVAVNDLMQARGALHQFKLLVDSGAGDDATIRTIGDVLVAGTNEAAPTTREEVSHYLRGLWERINGSLPYW